MGYGLAGEDGGQQAGNRAGNAPSLPWHEGHNQPICTPAGHT